MAYPRLSRPYGTSFEKTDSFEAFTFSKALAVLSDFFIKNTLICTFYTPTKIKNEAFFL